METSVYQSNISIFHKFLYLLISSIIIIIGESGIVFRANIMFTGLTEPNFFALGNATGSRYRREFY